MSKATKCNNTRRLSDPETLRIAELTAKANSDPEAAAELAQHIAAETAKIRAKHLANKLERPKPTPSCSRAEKARRLRRNARGTV